MRPIHLALAVLIAAVWGFSFVAIELGVAQVPPFFLTALRFTFSAFPALLFIARPKEAWGWLAAFGLALGVGQFGIVFLAMRLGLPAGLSSLVMQVQAFWTMLFAWMVLKEIPRPRQICGAAIGFSGIAVIIYGRWSGTDLLPLVLCIIAAALWAVANIISKLAKPKNALSFVVWSSLAVPIPMLALSWIFENHAESLAALTSPSLQVIGALVYLSVFSTIFGFGAWNYLFSLYPASTVAPFSLLVPLFGVLGAAVVFGERFDNYELTGAVLIISGLVVSHFGLRLLDRPRRSGACSESRAGIKKAEPEEGPAN